MQSVYVDDLSFIFITTPWGVFYYDSHCRDEGTEAEWLGDVLKEIS